jgi:hypothetical protein
LAEWGVGVAVIGAAVNRRGFTGHSDQTVALMRVKLTEMYRPV